MEGLIGLLNIDESFSFELLHIHYTRKGKTHNYMFHKALHVFVVVFFLI